jgi:hypothetical protein
VLGELIRRNKTITSLCLVGNTFGLNAAAARSIFEGLRSNRALQHLDLRECGLDDQDVLILANALVSCNANKLELDLHNSRITSFGVRALVADNVEAVKTLTKLCLTFNPIKSEGATILADALRHNVMPSLKGLHLDNCSIEDDGFVALVSALEHNTSLQILDLQGNHFGERGYMALAESLPNITELHQIDFRANARNASFQSNLPLLMEGFRKNTSLVEVKSDGRANRVILREMKFLVSGTDSLLCRKPPTLQVLLRGSVSGPVRWPRSRQSLTYSFTFFATSPNWLGPLLVNRRSESLRPVESNRSVVGKDDSPLIFAFLPFISSQSSKDVSVVPSSHGKLCVNSRL